MSRCAHCILKIKTYYTVHELMNSVGSYGKSVKPDWLRVNFAREAAMYKNLRRSLHVVFTLACKQLKQRLLHYIFLNNVISQQI